jgi:hypothetical protein
MKIPITNPVTYNVANVEITSIGVNVRNDDITLSLSYCWLDAAGVAIKTDSKRYTGAELETMFQAMGGSFAPLSAFFKSLFPVGKAPGMTMNMSDAGVLTVTTGIGVDCPDGVCRYTQTIVLEETLNAKLAENGLSQAPVTGVLAASTSVTGDDLRVCFERSG